MSKFVDFMKAHVVGPLMTAAGAVGALVASSGKFDVKEALMVFVGALLGAVLHKEVVVKLAA